MEIEVSAETLKYYIQMEEETEDWLAYEREHPGAFGYIKRGTSK